MDNQTTSSNNLMNYDDDYNYNLFMSIGSYFPLVIISFGFVGNLASFFLFTMNSNLNTLSSFIYLAFISLVDTLSLFNWNLDHFLKPNFNLSILNTNIIACKLLSFFQYFGLQSSGILHCLLIIDLYYVLAKKRFNYTKRKFATVKSAIVWSVGLLSFLALINIHYLIFNGYWTYSTDVYQNRTVYLDNNNNNQEIKLFKTKQYAPFKCNMYPFNLTFLLQIYDYVLLCIYNLIPCIIIPIFCVLILCKMYSINSHLNETAKKHFLLKDIKRITYSIVIMSILFVLMTAPTQIMYKIS